MASNLKFRLTGGASNTDQHASFGGVMSSSEVSNTALNNLFKDVTPDQAINGVKNPGHFRAIDVLNTGDAEAQAVEIYMSTETPSDDTQLNIGHEAENNPHASDWAGQLLDNENTAPSDPSVTMNHPLEGSKLSLPNIPAGMACRIWIEREVDAGAINTPNDQGTITVKYA